MPTIGAPLRTWTLLLLVCSSATYVTGHAANETSNAISAATAASSITTPSSPAATATVPLPSQAPSPAPRRYSNSDAQCPARTINYITHTLPQQCAKTSWSAPSETASTHITTGEAQSQPTTNAPTNTGEPRPEAESQLDDKLSSAISLIAAHAHGTPSGTAGDSGVEVETDSPFDNASFLSFEEWKKKNLERVGQSPENVGQGRTAPSGEQARRRPVNVNALDSLGDEGEIELDFSGFGNPGDKKETSNQSRQEGTQEPGMAKATGEEGIAAPSSWALSKDAGKTCKERFNYASFDCAATVLKTNKQAKSATSILVENKDSYMLNECSADNKFLIVELCDDILVDTIVLANYEFFSSMFRHFRVSVSDRYPVKLERWRTLGTFEARNSRDIQPFLITEPQIWARYLRVEFLTQYGNEFYCPLSLIRVHGTTMMEQFRQEEEQARGIEDDGDLEAESRDVVKPAEDSGPLPPDQIPIQAVKDGIAGSQDTSSSESITTATPSSGPETVPSQTPQQGQEHDMPSGSTTVASVTEFTEAASDTAAAVSSSPAVKQRGTSGESDPSASHGSSVPATPSPQSSTGSEISTQSQSHASDAATAVSSPPASQSSSPSSSTGNGTGSPPSNSQPAKAASDATGASPPIQPPPRGSSTQPNGAVPSTQESFFKSIHKRLLYLEANSTLSLQYIEEQSRSLRDAFLKVEKRQLAKTEKFLDHLNSTVMLELKSFRNMYDQLWQSTVIELESMKERQRNEMGEIGARLSLLADELVWQKRMAVVQSTLLLVCLGLVLFVRSGTLGSSTDVPIVQHLGSKYTSLFDTPSRPQPESGLARRRRTFRDMWRSDTSAGLSDRDHQSDAPHPLSDADTDGARSPLHNEYSPGSPNPPTPATLGARDARLHDRTLRAYADNDMDLSDPEPEPQLDPDDQAARIQVLETQSGPATPNGTRDCRPSWEEVDRAMDELKAEGRGASGHSDGPVGGSQVGRGEAVGKDEDRERERDRDKGKKKAKGKGKAMGNAQRLGQAQADKKSPLRRAYSSFDERNGDEDS
ncbi:hypothetical protein IAQ61_011954 [Plenodomus lingam]|uniref:uncharacterized protein n=1 Tax=Leptosphaeria maculans TaxID=5022 RepID=UPI00331656A0|nr:hypothetical protein IAQ61_011954 [Plenodomus lingam]